MTAPSLIEPGTKYFLGRTLKECRKYKDKHLTQLFNLGMIFVFFLLFGSILAYRYKGNISKSEQIVRSRKKKEYIISKLQQLSAIRQQKSMITDMPMWTTNPELEILNRK
tara:strand:- start:2244 stop:2573 length:330 start_codon:yes stop_codon:yes gene_type:complete